MSEALDVQPGETILVNGAGGVTGGMIVELAANRGATVIATASESSAARVMALGADVVIDYHDPEWTSRQGTPRDRRAFGLPRTLRLAESPMRSARSSTAVGWQPSPARHPPRNGASASRTSIVRPDGDELRLLAASLAKGKLHIDIRATYPLTRAAEALAQATKGSGGAIVLEP